LASEEGRLSMGILHRYILSQLVRNVALSLSVFTLLFLVVDFFDRIDNILQEDATVATIFEYFFLKIPGTLTFTVPMAMLAGTVLTVGILSKNSEMTAMRAAGLTVRWLMIPIFTCGFLLSLVSIALNETVIPYSNRRTKEIYNIDIKRKDKSGGYSQNDFWWRSRNEFYSVGTFDSRTNTLLGFSRFELNDKFEVQKRVDAGEVHYLDELLGWTMYGVNQYDFPRTGTVERAPLEKLPLPIEKKPSDFYDVETDPQTMSFRSLRAFIKQQAANGLAVSKYYADLYDKMAFPFVTFLLSIIVVPFALLPARSGSMARGIILSLAMGFSYYVVQSWSISMGRAELISPLLSAWITNVLMGVIGTVLLLGVESPQ
jgi:lipopolysaccharide export system permease protein